MHKRINIVTISFFVKIINLLNAKIVTLQKPGFYLSAILVFNILMMVKGTAWKKYTSKTYI